jgi:predicted RNA-binding Zn ribbon-like protein
VAIAVTGVQAVFEITGGHLALDLANTLERRPTPQPEEHLRAYGDLVAWGRQAGAVAAEEADRLLALAKERPRAARAALARALQVREALFALFSAMAGRRPLPPGALARVNSTLPAALAHARLTTDGAGAAWTWVEEPDLDRVLWPVLRGAGELLASPDHQLVRACAARDCDWLFLDRSRNGSRRWCDMAVCGNREKARRFQRRARRPRK